MGLGNIFAYPRLKMIGGSLGTDGMINRPSKMIAALKKSQRAYSNTKNLELGFERVSDATTEVLPTKKDMSKF